MRCTSPRTVGFKPDGKTISWSQKNFSKEFATFQLPCGKCIECRLEYARQWAIRCMHEAQMHPENSFITLTYSDENLLSPKLQYEDFQLFMKRLRKHSNNEIGMFVTGEYGDKTKRPHWHALLFNYRPSDSIYKYTNDHGDRVYSSAILDQLWGKGIAELGQITLKSAGYCARYAAKKLVHGHDQEHDFQPISKKSSKNAIGKKWLEKYWEDVFNYGQIVLPDGSTCSLPRYYQKWLLKHKPEEYKHYVTETKNKKTEHALARAYAEAVSYFEQSRKRTFKGPLKTRIQARKEITEQKHKLALSKLKL
nr:MAG: replication initiator protein [Microvirus sp.]